MLSAQADMPPLAARITDSYAALSKQERQLADTVLACVRDLAGYTATELALRAGVSKATATRFFRRLGYTDFGEARLESRRSPFHGSPLEAFYGNSPKPTAADATEDHLKLEVRNLAETFASITAEDVASAAETLTSARKVWIIGFRDSYPLALYASAMLSRVLEQVCVLPRNGDSFAEDLIGLSENDTVLAIGFRRRPRIFETLLQVAHDQSAATILLTDTSASRAIALGTVAFRCYSRGAIFDSHAAGLSLLNMLCSQVVLATGEHGKARLRAAERLHNAIKELPIGAPGRRQGG